MSETKRDDERQTAWRGFMRSPLTVFAGVFSLLEAVVLAFLSRSEALDPVDALVVILLTVLLFVIVVIARPQALYPPSEWREPTPAPDARIALIALSIFIFVIGGAWGWKLMLPYLQYGSSAPSPAKMEDSN